MNYYRAVEKKPEHGGGWAFMQLNRRAGAAIVCGCGAGGWESHGHDTPEAAERCFYEAEKEKGVRWSVYTQASKCVVCNEWTADSLHAASNLVTADATVCKSHFDGEDRPDAAAWLWDRNPFSPGIQIAASW